MKSRNKNFIFAFSMFRAFVMFFIGVYSCVWNKSYGMLGN